MILADQLKTIRSHQSEPPVNVVRIAKNFGIKVYRSRPGKWPGSLSGVLRRDPDDNEKFQIYTNGDHHIHRRRFTIAHEIAHFILHRDLIGTGIRDDALYRSGLSNRLEAEANLLAADILMPWHLLKSFEQESSTIKSLAEIFKVSKDAMSIRLLGIPYRMAD